MSFYGLRKWARCGPKKCRRHGGAAQSERLQQEHRDGRDDEGRDSGLHHGIAEKFPHLEA
jgi:hypothetical protein